MKRVFSRSPFRPVTGAILSTVLAAGPVLGDQLDTIVVGDVQDKLQRAGTVKDTILKTEVITPKVMERKQAKTLTEAIDNEPGINVQNGCSICGIKRVQINGLKGEYTTVLVDDVPLHSTVSSYYGFDAMVTAGIARIEVARGAGASLIAPEAIGGVINVITKKATENSFMVDLAGGNADYRVLSLMGTWVSKDGAKRVTAAAQHNTEGQWDSDGNCVNEAPERKNYSALVRFSDDLSPTMNLDVRATALKSSTFGGPVGGSVFGSAIQPGGISFEGGDVRRRYTGSPQQVNETVIVDRAEIVTKLTKILSDDTNVIATAAISQQKQDSMYEGNDYAHVNDTYFADLRANHQLVKDHLLTFGSDIKIERLRSRSYQYFTVLGVAKDDFDYLAPGVYLQDTWTPHPRLEVSGAVRAALIRTDWLGKTAKANEIDRGILVPRLHVKWTHQPELVSRFSVGQGYRTPLTFFESEHGILDNGFDINVSDVERSSSAVYSLSFDDKVTAATLSGAWTGVTNLAYIDTSGARPALTSNSGTVSIGAVDAVASRQITSSVGLGVGYEHFFYESRYKALLPMAAIEDRARFMVDVDYEGWEANVTLNVVGGRDLAPYGYGGRFNVFDAGAASAPKRTRAPTFVTADVRISRKVGREMSFYIGVRNLFDYTQTQTDSPLFFDSAGKLDVTHVWGPLRGRQFYAGIQARF